MAADWVTRGLTQMDVADPTAGRDRRVRLTAGTDQQRGGTDGAPLKLST